MRIGEYIDKYLQANNMSQRQFAKKCNLSNGYISMLINNTNPKTGKPLVPSLTALLSISKGMGISLDELINQTDDIDVDISFTKNISSFDREKEIDLSRFPNIMPIKTKKFPLVGEIACGEPIFANEEYETFIEASADIRADFCLRAKGDSMIGARIHDGDIVFIQKASLVENGQIAAVVIDDVATLKRWYYYREKNKLILNPENPAFEPLVFTNEELDHVHCLGRAVYLMSRL